MKKHLLVFFLVLLSLSGGVLIYATTRSEALWLNQWLAPMAGSWASSLSRTFLSDSELPQWIIYSLPDGLWMLALTLSILMIWNFKLHRHSITWLVAAGLTGIIIEISQGFNFLPGSFDPGDLLLIFLGFLMPLSFFYIKFRLCKTV